MMSERLVHRVGIGTDLHRLERGGPLRIGGIDIPFDHHLAGHSDADVVLHAVADALLGAAGLPDIGERYPDTDPAWRGADSRTLLGEVVADLHRRGMSIVNVDLVIQAQRPKLSSHKPAIGTALSALLEVSADCIAVKAKTNEGLDAVGRGEAISCIAIVGLNAKSC